jgi:beta-glucosidase
VWGLIVLAAGFGGALVAVDLWRRLPRRTPIVSLPGEGASLAPAGFLWGTATADHQIEHAQADDWTAFEWRARGDRLQTELRLGMVQPGHIAGIADVPAAWIERKTDFDRLMEDDLERCRDLGTNAFRFSISWARLFPRAGMTQPDPDGVAFYDRLLDLCERAGQEPSATLLHFASPQWLWSPDEHGRRGYERDDVVEHFRVFSAFCAARWGRQIRHWCTLNEPMVLVYFGYLEGVFPPGERRKNPSEVTSVAAQLLRMHAAAWREIKAVRPDSLVGIAHHVRHFIPFRNASLLDRVTALLVDRAFVLDFMDAIAHGELRPALGGNAVVIPGLQGTMDYVGLNFYGRFYVKASTPGKFEIVSHDPQEPGEEESDVGWAVDETSFLPEIMRFHARYRLPIYILENGIADDRSDDHMRQRFLVRHVRAMLKAIEAGVDVRGFFYWSLIDNFEWAAGFGPRFGLYRVDYDTGERSPRQSVDVYRQIARDHGVSASLWQRFKR